MSWPAKSIESSLPPTEPIGQSCMFIPEIPLEICCPVCREIFVRPLTLPCQHVICSPCAKQLWNDARKDQRIVRCPICRGHCGSPDAMLGQGTLDIPIFPPASMHQSLVEAFLMNLARSPSESSVDDSGVHVGSRLFGLYGLDMLVGTNTGHNSSDERTCASADCDERASHFCSNGCGYLCGKCLGWHNRLPMSRCHATVKIGGKRYHSIFTNFCQKHPQMKYEIYCNHCKISPFLCLWCAHEDKTINPSHVHVKYEEGMAIIQSRSRELLKEVDGKLEYIATEKQRILKESEELEDQVENIKVQIAEHISEYRKILREAEENLNRLEIELIQNVEQLQTELTKPLTLQLDDISQALQHIEYGRKICTLALDQSNTPPHKKPTSDPDKGSSKPSPSHHHHHSPQDHAKNATDSESVISDSDTEGGDDDTRDYGDSPRHHSVGTGAMFSVDGATTSNSASPLWEEHEPGKKPPRNKTAHMSMNVPTLPYAVEFLSACLQRSFPSASSPRSLEQAKMVFRHANSIRIETRMPRKLDWVVITGPSRLVFRTIDEFGESGKKELGPCPMVTKGFDCQIPCGVAVHPESGLIYVTDYAAHRVHILSPEDLTVQRHIQSEANGSANFNGPIGVAISLDGRVAIVGNGSNRVQIYDENGRWRQTIGRNSSGNAPGQFNCPYHAAFDRFGNLFVTDNSNSRVQKFDPHGNHVCSFGAAGSGLGETPSADAIIVGHDDLVYILGQNTDVIKVFDTDGQYRSSVKIHRIQNANMCRGPADTLFVSDYHRHQIYVYSLRGTLLKVFAAPGSQIGQLQSPMGLAFGLNHLLYVCEHGNRRLQAF